MVRMADGTSKPIEEIVVGDEVLGANMSGQVTPVRVVRVYDNGLRACSSVTFRSPIDLFPPRTLVATLSHKLLALPCVAGAAPYAKSELADIIGNNTQVTVTIRSPIFGYEQLSASVHSHNDVGLLETYDIEVDHPDHLFVLENGLIVSNSAKHSGGVAGQEKAVSGFDLLNQLVQVPKKMRGGAAHAITDGRVESITEAPAGGYNVVVAGKKHFVPAGRELRVKSGDEIEAGDLLSDGIPNPAMIVEHKGVGEGRRYFVNEFRKAMQEGGMPANRRNVELLARGLINHVQLTDEYDDYVPDDVIPYSTLERSWQPRTGYEEIDPQNAVGKYLERPILHHSIGTKIRPSMLPQLTEFGVKKVVVHKEPPPFKPHMVRAMYQMQHDPDWMTQMYGSGLKKSLLTSAARGATSDPAGTSFVPSLAAGANFGATPGHAVRSPAPGYSLPAVPLPDPNLLSYKEAIDGTGVDTTPAPPKTPPATPAGPLPSGPLASSSSPQLFPGANYLRQSGSGVGLSLPSHKVWQPGEAARLSAPVASAAGASRAAAAPGLMSQFESAVGATRVTGAAGAAARNKLVPGVVGNAASRVTGAIGQTATKAMPTLSRVAPKVLAPVTKALGPGSLRPAVAVSAGLNSLDAVTDIASQGHVAAGHEHLSKLQDLSSNLLSGKVDWSTPGQVYDVLSNPVANANAAGVGATQIFNELQTGAGSAIKDVATNRAADILGTNTQIKDPEISSMHLNNPKLPVRIRNTISDIDNQIAAATDPAQVQQLRDRRARFDTLLKSYGQNAGALGTGRFGTLFTGNLQGLKQRLMDVSRQLQDATLDPLQRQDLMMQQSRLQNDIATYRSWSS